MPHAHRTRGGFPSPWGSRALRGPALAALLASVGCSEEIVTVASVAVVEVTPGSETLLVGEERQFEAVPRDVQGRPLQDREILWSVLPSSRGSVTGGRFVAAERGEAEIRATVEGVSGSAQVTVLIQVSFADPSLEAAVREAIGKPDGAISDADLSGLVELEAPFSGISDIRGLEFATSLEFLRLSNNSISDITPLQGLTGLTQLFLGGNSISDITPLQGLTGLTDLGLDGNPISDFTPLQGLTGLTVLGLSGNSISDITPLQGLTGLTDLNLEVNSISDITPLQGLTGLTQLFLSENQISDITPLQGLTGLTDLRLGGNQISDITPLQGLTGLTSLLLINNSITDVQALVDNDGIGAGDEVDLRQNPLSQQALCEQIPALQGRGVDVSFDGAC